MTMIYRRTYIRKPVFRLDFTPIAICLSLNGNKYHVKGITALIEV